MPFREIRPEDDRALQNIADDLVRSHKQILVTGAGISTSCGIPDFRSKDGLYNVIPEQAVLPTPPPSSPSTPASRKRKATEIDDDGPPSSQLSIFSSSSYRSSPSSRMRGEDLFNSRVFHSADTTTIFYQFIATLRHKIMNEVEQTSATHKFIRTLRDGGRLMRCYTQNIDGLESREGLCMDLAAGRGNKRRFMKKNIETPRPQETKDTDFEAGCEVVQLHGELSNLRCRVCATEQEWTEDETEVFLEGAAPNCELCEEKSLVRQATGKRGLAIGELRPNIVLYGEDHPQNSLLVPLIAFDQSSNPDLLIIMGTSLRVHGLQKVVRDFAKIVHNQKNGRVVFVNRTRPSESQWDGIIDDYVAMDCDDWVNDLKRRRGDLWLQQGEISLKSTKVTAQKRKRKSDVDFDIENNHPKKRQDVRVDVPILKQSQSKSSSRSASQKSSSTTRTPAKPKQTGWKNRDLQEPQDFGVLSPIARHRPQSSPLKRHFKPLISSNHAGENYVPGSPMSPAHSTITVRTPSTVESREDKIRTSGLTTPTPRRNMARTKLHETRPKRSSGLRNEEKSPVRQAKSAKSTEIIILEDDDDEDEQQALPDARRQLSLVETDGKPLFARSTSVIAQFLAILK